MNAKRSAVFVTAALLLVAGCATSPQDEDRREAIEAVIRR